MATLLASILPARFSASAPHLLLRALPRIRLRRALASAPRMSSSSAAAAADGGGSGEKPVAAPYGSWRSPITADVVSGADKRLGGIALAGDGRLLWIEGRPEEKGRMVIVKEDDKPVDIIPQEFAARTLAQEYGGGAFAVKDNVVVFSNYKDQRLYKQTTETGVPVPLTPDYGGPDVSYADGVFDPHFSRYVTVIEEPKVLISGNDFYAFPRIDHNNKRMAWIEWSHPNMPWDKSELWVGYFSESGDLTKRVCVAGSNPMLVESPTEPKWSPKGELFFITDRGSGFWNIYKWVEHTNEVIPVYTLDAEFTRPLWVFGISSYGFLGESNHIIFNYRQHGRSYLGVLDSDIGSVSLLDTPFTDLSNVVTGNDYFYIEGASATVPMSIAKVALNEDRTKVVSFSIIWSSSSDVVQYSSFFSAPEFVEFPTSSTGQKAYAYFYPPLNPNFQGLPDEKPPLLVKTHGGPTAETRGILDLSVQYWTSRGWAYLDVNYGGSTGFGREYRERLLGKWGIVDVDDCCSCARFLVENGKVDEQRLCITGRSAGGYTTLASLAFRDTFKAGASLYGIGDLSLLRAETHKFESHYIDNLVGNEKAYYERSPINFVDKFTCPVILFQGLDDKVVPPDQARKIYKALKEKGLPVALVEYEGEQHGFRKAENIKFTLEQQMVFFARLVGNFKKNHVFKLQTKNEFEF
uniref:Peptidase S9 prolyl oligopeptidase catalytic domain-containing protein n=1 Tax=Oryza punctata TaxID=4537 RepID=A0A0E0L9B2_ORYPU